MKLEDLTLADVARLLEAVKKLKPDDPLFVQQVIAREEIPEQLLYPRVTLSSLFVLLNQTGGSTALPDDIVQILKTETETQASPVCGAAVAEVKKYAPTPEELETVGTQVRIRRDSKFAHQNNGTGVVTNKDRIGWVRVKFANGNNNVYRIGLEIPNDSQCVRGECDLELADPPTVAVVAIATAPGKIESFEVLIPADHPRQPVEPGDIVQIDPITRQVINT